MTVLLVSVANRIRQVAILLNLPFDGVGRYTHARVAVSAVHNAPPTGISAQPKKAVVELCDRIGRDTTNLVKRTLDTLQRERHVARVVPNFDRVSAKQPSLTVVDDQRHQTVGRTLGAGKVQRVNGQTVKQTGYPDLLAVRLIKNKIAVQKTNSYRARKVWVGNLLKHVSGGVIDVAGAVGGNKQLRAVV